MRPQEIRRYPDEQFYFDERELVVDEQVLPEHYPQVQMLQGRNVVAIYEDGQGNERGKEYQVGWRQVFFAGQRIIRIETGDSEVQLDWIAERYADSRFTGEILDSYTIEEGDLWVAEYDPHTEHSTREMVYLDASEPFPGDGYSPMGIIKSSGELVSWEGAGGRTRWLCDLVLANSLVANNYDLAVVNKELGSQLSLSGSISGRDLTQAYLMWFEDRFGVDVMPTEDPKWRHPEFPGILTDHQRNRIFGSH